MFNLGDIQSAKKKAVEHYEKHADNFNEEFNQALHFLKEFTDTQDQNKLKQAAGKFFNAIKCKISRIEPYLYLSYIFYLFDENDLAHEYLETARQLDSDNEQLLELQKLLLPT